MQLIKDGYIYTITPAMGSAYYVSVVAIGAYSVIGGVRGFILDM